jgi:hypothetical protein
MFNDLTYIAAVVLIPLIPAFLLYKFLRSGRTSVGGPFRGLDIKLSGAFAGYFLMVLVVSSFVVFLIRQKPIPIPPAYQYEVYTVQGQVELQPADTSAERLDYRNVTLSLQPPPSAVKTDGSFSFEIPVKRGQIGEPEFPDLLLGYNEPNFELRTVHLDEKSPYDQDFQVTYNKERKTIIIAPRIQLTQKAAYGSSTPDTKPSEIP